MKLNQINDFVLFVCLFFSFRVGACSPFSSFYILCEKLLQQRE